MAKPRTENYTGDWQKDVGGISDALREERAHFYLEKARLKLQVETGRDIDEKLKNPESLGMVPFEKIKAASYETEVTKGMQLYKILDAFFKDNVNVTDTDSRKKEVFTSLYFLNKQANIDRLNIGWKVSIADGALTITDGSKTIFDHVALRPSTDKQVHVTFDTPAKPDIVKPSPDRAPEPLAPAVKPAEPLKKTPTETAIAASTAGAAKPDDAPSVPAEVPTQKPEPAAEPPPTPPEKPKPPTHESPTGPETVEPASTAGEGLSRESATEPLIMAERPDAPSKPLTRENPVIPGTEVTPTATLAEPTSHESATEPAPLTEEVATEQPVAPAATPAPEPKPVPAVTPTPAPSKPPVSEKTPVSEKEKEDSPVLKDFKTQTKAFEADLVTFAKEMKMTGNAALEVIKHENGALEAKQSSPFEFLGNTFSFGIVFGRYEAHVVTKDKKTYDIASFEGELGKSHLFEMVRNFIVDKKIGASPEPTLPETPSAAPPAAPAEPSASPSDAPPAAPTATPEAQKEKAPTGPHTFDYEITTQKDLDEKINRNRNKVILEIGAPWCHPCQNFKAEMRALRPIFEAHGIDFVSIDRDSVAASPKVDFKGAIHIKKDYGFNFRTEGIPLMYILKEREGGASPEARTLSYGIVHALQIFNQYKIQLTPEERATVIQEAAKYQYHFFLSQNEMSDAGISQEEMPQVLRAAVIAAVNADNYSYLLESLDEFQNIYGAREIMNWAAGENPTSFLKHKDAIANSVPYKQELIDIAEKAAAEPK